MTIEERIARHTRGAATALAADLHQRKIERLLATTRTRPVSRKEPTA